MCDVPTTSGFEYSRQLADGERYSGSYDNGVPHGKGTYRFKNGNIYEGEYQYGKIHGQGTIRFPDNRRYIGEFKDNKKSGKGRYEGANGIYEGDYFDGEAPGSAIISQTTISNKRPTSQARKMDSGHSLGLTGVNTRARKSCSCLHIPVADRSWPASI